MKASLGSGAVLVLAEDGGKATAVPRASRPI